MSEYSGLSGEAPCTICGKPSTSRRHREKCLKKSEKRIRKALKKNKRKGSSTGFLHEYEKRMIENGAQRTKCSVCGQTIWYMTEKPELCPKCFSDANGN